MQSCSEWYITCGCNMQTPARLLDPSSTPVQIIATLIRPTGNTTLNSKLCYHSALSPLGQASSSMLDSQPQPKNLLCSQPNSLRQAGLNTTRSSRTDTDAKQARLEEGDLNIS